MLVAAKENEPSKLGTKAPSVPSPQSASHVHTTLLDYLQAFQRNEDPGEDLIRDSRLTLSDHLNGDMFTDVHTPSVISTNKPHSHSIPLKPIDIRYGWPRVDVSPFPFNLTNVNSPLHADAVAAASHGDAFLCQQAHLPPHGLSHGAVLGAAEENSSDLEQFFASQMAALENNGPDQGWESFLYPG